MPTRNKFSPNGFTSPWLISCLTAVKLMAKNKLVNNNARCAFVLCFNMPVLTQQNYTFLPVRIILCA